MKFNKFKKMSGPNNYLWLLCLALMMISPVITDCNATPTGRDAAEKQSTKSVANTAKGKSIFMHHPKGEFTIDSVAIDSIRLEFRVDLRPWESRLISAINIYPDSAVRFSIFKKGEDVRRSATLHEKNPKLNKSAVTKEEYDRMLHLIDDLFFSWSYPVETGRIYTGLIDTAPSQKVIVQIYSDNYTTNCDEIKVDLKRTQDLYEITFSDEMLELADLVRGDAL